MNNEIIIFNDRKNNSTPNELSYFDVYSEVYRELNETGKEISKSYDDNLKITFIDLDELHRKILQTIISQNGTGVILKINMEQLRGENATFTDFDDFAKNNTSGPNPTQEVILTYNYIIKNEAERTIERYKIIIRLLSRVAQYHDATTRAPEFMLEFLSHFKSNVAKIDVEYYDYVKARSFLSTFDEWINGCSKTATPKFLNIFNLTFNKLNWLIKLFILFLLTFNAYNHIDDNSDKISYIIKYFIIYTFSFYFILTVVNNTFTIIRKSINSYFLISYVSINKGDTHLISKYTTYNNKNIFKSILGILSTIFIGILSSSSYDFIKLLLAN